MEEIKSMYNVCARGVHPCTSVYVCVFHVCVRVCACDSDVHVCEHVCVCF